MFGDKSKKIISFVLVFCLVFSVIFIPPKKTDAGVGAALGACLAPIMGAMIASLVSPTVPSDSYGALFQDCLDGLITFAANEVLERITNDMVKWANSGFDGNPAFVQDYNKLLSDVSDEAIGSFIENTPELAFMCSPFQLEIKKALIRANSRGSGGRFEREVTCKLSDVTSNVENFLNGDFTDGGWDAWRELAFDNPYSNFLEVSIELQGRQLTALNKIEKEVEVGRGFLSYTKPDNACVAEVRQNIADWNATHPNEGGAGFDAIADALEVEKDIKKMCPDKVETPGSVIEAQLNNALPSGMRKLEMADEVNEMIAAVLAALVNKVVSQGLSNQ